MRIATAANGTHEQSLRELQFAIAHALDVLEHCERATARAQADLGDIELPDASPAAGVDPALLAPIGPLYLAYQLELAGLLRTAELIAGLFASGSINASLGAAEPLLAAFWRNRRTRLAQQERVELFGRVFEPDAFDPLLDALMQAIASVGDGVAVDEWREAALVERAGERLLEFLAARAGGMLAFAARDITAAINDALRFMREPPLLAAFSVHDMWQLLQFAAGDGDVPLARIVQHADLGKSGDVVLGWLASAAHAASLRFDRTTPKFDEIVGAAQRWLAANATSGEAPSLRASTPIVPMMPVAPAPLQPALAAS